MFGRRCSTKLCCQWKTIKRKNIQIQFKAEKDFEVEGYPNMLSHVILNILNNSRDVLLEREIKKPKIWINLKQKKDQSLHKNKCMVSEQNHKS